MTEFYSRRDRFGREAGIKWIDRPFWLAICRVCKKPLRPDVERLLTQSLASLTAAADRLNSSSEAGRATAVTLQFDHACELVINAGLMDRPVGG